jgi:predicted Zn-dependent protease
MEAAATIVLTRPTNRKRWKLAAGAARGAGALTLALAVGACSSFPVGREISLPDLPKSAEPNSLSVREHQRVVSAYGGTYEDPRLHDKLTTIVESLTAHSERPDLHYKITILNSPAVNAFALPSGQLYVTRGLLALANDSAEVASVMSHEMAHVIARHAEIREEAARKTELISNINDALGGSQVGAMALARSKIVLATFSRSQETEADSIGVGIAARAGYDPFGAARLLNSMGRNAELRSAGRDTRSLDFTSSHPATPERVRNVQATARNLPATGPRVRDRSAYLLSLDGMKYGDDTDEGFVRGRQFMHPKLGFTFMAPEGFILDNTAEAVLGSKESAGQALRFDVVKVPADRSLVEYLNSGWIENIEDGSVEEMVVNGIPAATATASPAATASSSGDSWRFRLYVMKLGGDVYRFIFAAKNLTEDADKSFRDSILTFRRLSEREKAARPLHLKVVKVQPGDTVESIASEMIFADHQVERFLVLNGLDSKAELKPGELVKIVVE